jgi:hypothetical protein
MTNDEQSEKKLFKCRVTAAKRRNEIGREEIMRLINSSEVNNSLSPYTFFAIKM